MLVAYNQKEAPIPPSKPYTLPAPGFEPTRIEASPLVDGRRTKRPLYVIPILGDQLYALFAADGPELPVGMICAAFDEGDDPDFPNRFPDGLHKAERGFSQILVDIELRQIQQKSWDWVETRNLVDASLKAAAYKGATTKLLTQLRMYVLELRGWALRCLESRALDGAVQEHALKLDLMRFRPYYSWFELARTDLVAFRMGRIIAACDVMLARFELESVMWSLSNTIRLGARLELTPRSVDEQHLPLTERAMATLTHTENILVSAIEQLDLNSGKVQAHLKHFRNLFESRHWRESKEPLEYAFLELDKLPRN